MLSTLAHIQNGSIYNSLFLVDIAKKKTWIIYLWYWFHIHRDSFETVNAKNDDEDI